MIMVHILILTHPHSLIKLQPHPIKSRMCLAHMHKTCTKNTHPKPRHTAAKGGSKCMTSRAGEDSHVSFEAKVTLCSWINTTNPLARRGGSRQSGLEISNAYHQASSSPDKGYMEASYSWFVCLPLSLHKSPCLVNTTSDWPMPSLNKNSQQSQCGQCYSLPPSS